MLRGLSRNFQKKLSHSPRAELASVSGKRKRQAVFAPCHAPLLFAMPLRINRVVDGARQGQRVGHGKPLDSSIRSDVMIQMRTPPPPMRQPRRGARLAFEEFREERELALDGSFMP
jgi:hypothetical protein